jgi:hypothetical protein
MDPLMPMLRTNFPVPIPIPDGGILDAILDTLGAPVGNLVISGWQKHRDLQRAQQDTLAHPGTTKFIRLGQHTIHSTHQPRIDIEINGKRQAILVLDLEITLEVETVGLVVAHGDIIELAPGTAIAEMKLKAGNVLLKESRSRPIELAMYGGNSPAVAHGVGNDWKDL